MVVVGAVGGKWCQTCVEKEPLLRCCLVEGLEQKFPPRLEDDGNAVSITIMYADACAPRFHRTRTRRRWGNGIGRLGLVSHEGCQGDCRRGDAYAFQRSSSAEVKSALPLSTIAWREMFLGEVKRGPVGE